ncbi:MAG: ABC transporter permease [Gemmatimonadetes bacterium]|nr:ABC transporter permease [Gemmatimonadota bacterium]
MVWSPLRSWLSRLTRRYRATGLEPDPDGEVEEELGFHLDMRTQELMEEGLTEQEARRAAEARFRDLNRVRSECERLAEQWEWRTMWKTVFSELGTDLRFGIRQLMRYPALALAAVVTLGLGIGANTAVFSVVNGVMLSPLGFPDAESLVEVRTRYLPPSGFDIDRFPISVSEFLDYREASTAYEVLGAYSLGSRTLTGEGAEPARVPTVFLDRGALEALAVQPQLGRWFTEEEDQLRNALGLIAHDLWATRFGSDPDIVGTTAVVNGRSFLITGVMPEGFAFPTASYQIFENAGIDPEDRGNRASHGTAGIGRLRGDVSFTEAEAEAATVAAAWAEEYPHNVAHFPILERLSDNVVGLDVRRTLLLLMAAVGLVALIATANVANLLMARGERRLGEMSVRQALGASRSRVVRQLAVESLILAVAGGALGVALGTVGLSALLRIDPGALPRAHLIGLNGGVLVFTALVTLLTSLLFGLAPAVQAGRSTLAAATREVKASSGKGGGTFRRLLVTAQVALSVLVLASAGLVVKSFATLTAVDPGIEVENRLVFGLAAVGNRYRDGDEVRRFYSEVQDALQAIPGVSSVSAVSQLPLAGSDSRNDFVIEGDPPPSDNDPAWSAQWTSVLPGYFETMAIPVRHGRLLDHTDTWDTEPVAVVSQDVVDEYFGGEVPLNRRVAMTQDSLRWLRIVGVVPRTTQSLDGDPIPQIYFPLAQGLGSSRWASRYMAFALRTAGETSLLIPAVRARVAELDPLVPLTGLGPMEDVFDRSVARPRLITTLFGSFGLIALALATVGVFGVVSYSVSRRTREIGICMALGADRDRILRRVVREGAWPAVAGLLLGAPLAFAAGRLWGTTLFGVSPNDPTVLAWVGVVLVGAALVSSYLPARRAAGLAPTEALRVD